MSKVIKATLTDEQATKASILAKKNGLSLSAYIHSLIKLQDLGDTTAVESIIDDEASSEPEKAVVKLSGDYARLLRQKAEENACTASQYVKKLLLNGGKIYNLEVVTEDIDNYIAEIDRIATSVNSMVRIINSTGGEVMKQDSERMVQYLQDIKDLMHKQLQTSYSNRRQVQSKILKKLNKEISHEGKKKGSQLL